jgi:hypothetical protein
MDLLVLVHVDNSTKKLNADLINTYIIMLDELRLIYIRLLY